jgi:hypothetical protein
MSSYFRKRGHLCWDSFRRGKRIQGYGVEADIENMATHDLQPWWERPAKSPTEAEFEPERERLRAEMARAWKARVDDCQRRRATTATAGPQGPPLAAA